MMPKWVARVVLLVVVAATLTFWLTEADFATTTRYCPWKHRWGFTPQVCKVKDVQGSRVLVEHANLDVNVLELSIYQAGRTTWIQHPNGHVRHLSNKLDDNTIKFDLTDGRFLIVNGERFSIVVLKSEQ